MVPSGKLAFFANLCLLPLIPTPVEHLFMLSSHLCLTQQLLQHKQITLSLVVSSLPVLVIYYSADFLLARQTFLPLLSVSVYCAVGMLSCSSQLTRVFKPKSA